MIANCCRFCFRNKGASHDAYLTLNARGNIVWLYDDGTQTLTAITAPSLPSPATCRTEYHYGN